VKLWTTAAVLAVCGGLGYAQAEKKAPPKKGAAAAVPDWGQFRGPNRDCHSPDTGLLAPWPQGGPPLAWKVKGVGGGFASLAVAGGKIYTTGDLADGSVVTCLNAADGKQVWQAKLGPKADPGGYPGTRGTPATDGTLVFALGQQGDLVCYQAATGREVWRTNLEKFGGRMMSGWGFSESPLIDGNLLVVTPGGSAGTVLALNKATGAKVWQSAELKDAAAYSSLVPVTWGNIPQYVVYTDKTVAGIVARTGQVAWKADRAGQTAVIPTPLVSKEGIVFVASGYNVGHNAFQVSFAGGGFRAAPLYDGKQMVNHVGGLVLVGDHVYGSDERQLKCMELKTGKVVWENPAVGKGSIAYADGHLYCRSDNGGVMVLVEATPTGYKEKGRFTQPDLSGRNTWAHHVIFGGKMYLRDMDAVFCYTLAAK
jgi:outer membrane protein assembly factor BamB